MVNLLEATFWINSRTGNLTFKYW